MTVYIPKVVTRPKTKYQGSKGAISCPTIVNGLVGSFILRRTQIHFCETGVKMNDEVYRVMLNDILPPLEETVFVDQDE